MNPTATGKNPLWTRSMSNVSRGKKCVRVRGVFNHPLTWPEQKEESVDFQDNTDDRPAGQNHKNASQEEAGGFRFVPLEEEPEGALEADDKRKACHEEDLHTDTKYYKV